MLHNELLDRSHVLLKHRNLKLWKSFMWLFVNVINQNALDGLTSNFEETLQVMVLWIDWLFKVMGGRWWSQYGFDIYGCRYRVYMLPWEASHPSSMFVRNNSFNIFISVRCLCLICIFQVSEPVIGMWLVSIDNHKAWMKYELRYTPYIHIHIA